MTRIFEWEDRLNMVVAKHQGMPGHWGTSDCWALAMDAVEAVTGDRLLAELSSYTTEAGGYRLFRKQGFDTVEQALASVLEPINRFSAQRGDLGAVERDGVVSAGVFVSTGFAVRSLTDVQFLPVSDVKTAFKVT